MISVSMADNKRDNPKNEILVHLESIRNLLEKDRAAQREEAELNDSAQAQVPMLDDVVAGGLNLDESPLSEKLMFAGEQGGLDDALFKALLGDTWKESAATLLQESRRDIEQHRHHWSPSDTDALNEALKVRIDDTLRVWLRETVRRNVDQLRGVLLGAIEEQLKTEINNTLTRKKQMKPDTDPGADDKNGK